MSSQLLNKVVAYALVYRLWNDSPEKPGNYIRPHLRELRTRVQEYLAITNLHSNTIIEIEKVALDDEFTPDSATSLCVSILNKMDTLA